MLIFIIFINSLTTTVSDNYRITKPVESEFLYQSTFSSITGFSDDKIISYYTAEEENNDDHVEENNYHEGTTVENENVNNYNKHINQDRDKYINLFGKDEDVISLFPTSSSPQDFQNDDEKTRNNISHTTFSKINPVFENKTILPMLQKRHYYNGYSSNRPVPGNRGNRPPIKTRINPVSTTKSISTHLEQNNKNNKSGIQVTDMRCFATSNEGLFQAILTGDFRTSPVIENIKSNTENKCRILYIDELHYNLDINSSNLEACGVHQCGVDTQYNMCVSLRIPTVSKLVLPEDLIILLKCHPQETQISQTKQINFSPKEITGRKVDSRTKIIATGGTKAHFSTQVALFRHGSNGFTREISSGDYIVLGEQLLLQTMVNSGDGWKYSRLSDVIVYRLTDDVQGKKSVSDSVTLLDSNGCRNPAMSSISPMQPTVDQQNELTITFLFRAFMFNGMKEGDELVVSVKVLACVVQHHCLQNREELCDDDELDKTKIVRRKKRKTTIPDIAAGWTEDFMFKIIFNESVKENPQLSSPLPTTKNQIYDFEKIENRNTTRMLIVSSILCVSIIIVLMSLIILFLFHKLIY